MAAPLSGNSSFCPRPRCGPCVLFGFGVALGTVLGFSPWLCLATGSICLRRGRVLQKP